MLDVVRELRTRPKRVSVINAHLDFTCCTSLSGSTLRELRQLTFIRVQEMDRDCLSTFRFLEMCSAPTAAPTELGMDF